MKKNNWWNRAITWGDSIKMSIFAMLAILAFYAWAFGLIDAFVTKLWRIKNKFTNRNSTVHDFEEEG